MSSTSWGTRCCSRTSAKPRPTTHLKNLCKFLKARCVLIHEINFMSCWSVKTCLDFHTPVWKTGHIMETPAAGGRHPQGFCSPSQRVCIRSLSNFNLMNMIVGIISRPSSITSQIPHALLNCGPWIFQNKGFRSLSQRVFVLSWSKLVNMLVGISRPISITSQIPSCTPELWPLNCPKLGFLLSKSKSFHPVFIKLGEYVGGHDISTKFYNLPNPPRLSWIMVLEL